MKKSSALSPEEFKAYVEKNQLESELHERCLNWFRQIYPQYTKVFFHPANGEKRTIVTAMKLKRMGVVAGVSDFILQKANKKYGSLSIELKTRNNKQTEEQLQYEQSVISNGGYYALVRTRDEFIKIIQDYFNNRL